MNAGSLIAEVNGENSQKIDQSLNQNNLCVENSTCSNNGQLLVGFQSPTINQMHAFMDPVVVTLERTIRILVQMGLFVIIVGQIQKS